MILLFLLFTSTAFSYQWKNEYKIVLDYHLTDSPLLNYRDDKIYWQSFFEALAWAESEFNLHSRYKEPGMKDYYTNGDLWSEGMFQLSQQDKMLHGCEYFKWYGLGGDRFRWNMSDTKHIFQARNQIHCAVRIMVNQLQKRGDVFTDGSPYYWSVLDKKNRGWIKFLNHFNNIQKRNKLK